MPPSGPRSRPSQQAPPGRGANVRNEAFENIFGRPSVAHHTPSERPSAQPPFPPGPNGYPYNQGYHPAPPTGGQYLAPGQPSYPPGSSYGPPPPRGAPSFPPVFQQQPPPRTHDMNGYRPFSQPQDPQMGRRTSLAGSTHSSSSYYSPQPDPSPAPNNSHFSSNAYPAPPGSSRQPSVRGRPHPTLLTPAQAYQQSAYSDASSPASVVFPQRGMSQGSGSNLSLPSTSSGVSRNASVPSLASRSSNTEERMRSPPPDYVLAMGNMGFDGSGGGPLDNVPGIPRRGEMSDLGNFVQDEGTPRDRTHRRMASDSSVASSGGYTMTSMSGKTSIAPLSRIPQRDSPGPDDFSSPNTPTNSDGGFAFSGKHSNRKSMDSTMSLPLVGSDGIPTTAPSMSSAETRATSFSGGSVNRKELMKPVRSGSYSQRPAVGHSNSYGFPTPLPSNRSLTGTLNRSHSSARAIALQSLPQIYPALLSRVAEAFKQLITIGELTKDGLSYKDSFDGRTAVSIIAEIIKTPDRNLALLLGRALDAQKFFHDVTYDHRLRDNPNELYQFKERLAAPFVKDPAASDSPRSDHVHLGRATSTSSHKRPSPVPLTSESSSLQMSDSQTSWTASSSATPATSSTNLSQHHGSSPLTKLPSGSVPMGLNEDGEESEEDLPTGVFTLLTDCYSPTCSRENLCYSINCPRRLEQMKRLNMKPTGLSRKLSHESIHDEGKPTGTLWIESVSQEILDSTSDTEKKRQEAINEVIYTERDFVRDLEYLRDQWVKPLLSQDVIASSHREDFVRQVFWNVHDVLSVNHVLAERLTRRQKQQPVVSTIGDIFLERIPLFEPFVTYGAHQLFGKYEFEKEKEANLAFKKFVDETERKPESRKLELNGYLTKPTTRLGRYPLLLDAVLKYTADDSPDKKDIPEVIKAIKALLGKVNTEAAKSENIFELAQLEQQLVFRPNETIDLRLRDKNRELVHKGQLKRRGGNRDEIADLMGFLFDHAFLLVKPKWVNKAEQYRVYRRPIPLELLVVMTPDDSYKLSTGTSRSKLIARPSGGRSATTGHVPPKPESKHGFSLTIVHLGKKGYSMQLWVDTYVSRKKWLEAIDKQQTILRDRSCVFVTESITEGYFHGLRRINCVSPYDQGNRMIYGTDDGVYFSNLRDEKLREPVKVINLLDVTQVDVIEEYQLLIVLHERSVSTFPLDCLDPNDPNAALKRGKKISSHTSFFKSGLCLGKMLVAVVKSSTLSSTIKVLEPIDQSQRGKKQQGSFMKRLNGQNDALKLFKEFYIPTESSSVHFLRTKLCVGCTKGFEIVDLETLDMQGLLDPSDSSLDFVLKRDNVRPIAIYRIEEDFLLCYDEFAFYVNKTGWRSRPKWAIIWEGVPTAFALQYPYVIAFEPTFIEVHSVDTGHLVQIIPANNISCLFADTPPSRVNAPAVMPNRQWHYPPSAGPGFRPPPPGPGGPGHPPHGGAHGGGFPPSAYPPAPGNFYPQRPPPMSQFGGMPPPPVNRFIRNQVIFAADDGHVQFLKLPPPKTGSHGHAPRPSY